MSETILISVLVSAFSVLATFFVTHSQDRKIVQKHEQTCHARKDFQDIKIALAFLVIKTGGNPKDYNLIGDDHGSSD
jgi:type II secretory pathway component PulC